MKKFLFFLLVSTCLYSAPRISYFESLGIDLLNKDEVKGIYPEPTNSDILYYSSDTRVYKYYKGASEIILDVSGQENDLENPNSLGEEQKQLYDQIYEEEKEEIESEFSVSDAEEYYDDLLKERVASRMEDEIEMLRSKRGLTDKQVQYSEVIEKVEFLNTKIGKNLYKNMIVVISSEGLHISDSTDLNFSFKENSQIKSQDFSSIKYSPMDYFFHVKEQLYLYDGEEIKKVNLDMYEDEDVLKVYSNDPYLLVKTDKNMILLKRDEEKIKLVQKIANPKNDGDIFYFMGQFLFEKDNNEIKVFNIMDGSDFSLDLSEFDINDISYRKSNLFLASQNGVFLIDFESQQILDKSLGLFPEMSNNIVISESKKVFASNNRQIYVLKEFSSMKELFNDKSMIASMKKVDASYPPLSSILDSALKHNFSNYNTSESKVLLSQLMPKFNIRVRWDYKNTYSSLDMQETYYRYNLQDSLNVYAFLYFDLSRLIFHSPMLRVNRLKIDNFELKEELIEELTTYYNSRKLMEVLYNTVEGIDKIIFEMKMQEYGAIINSLTNKKFF